MPALEGSFELIRTTVFVFAKRDWPVRSSEEDEDWKVGSGLPLVPRWLGVGVPAPLASREPSGRRVGTGAQEGLEDSTRPLHHCLTQQLSKHVTAPGINNRDRPEGEAIMKGQGGGHGGTGDV